MKKIVLIGTFGDISKDIVSVLTKHFHVEECIDNPDLVKGFLAVEKPDVAIVSLVGMNKESGIILGELKNNYPKTPVICIGNESEQAVFRSYFRNSQFFTLLRPLSNQKILEKVCAVVGLLYDRIKDRITGETAPVSPKKRILLVDDSAIVLRTLNNFLTPAYEVQMATSGAKAIQLIEKRKPDMVFLDYEMPECNGMQTLQLIRAMDSAKDIPVVFLTGVNDKDHILALLALKPEGYLLKPASKEKIIEAIEGVLGGNAGNE